MKLLRTGWALLCVLGLAGCVARTAPDAADCRIAERLLDRDGVVLVRFSGPELRAVCDRTVAAWTEALWKSKESDTAARSRALLDVTEYRLWARLIGLGRLEWAGYSAKRLPKPGRAELHTELFLALPPDAPGLLNTFFSDRNALSFRDTLAGLPRCTELALVADLRPGELLKALKSAGAWGEKFILDWEAFWPLLEDTSGVWKLVQLRRPGQGEPDYVLQLPDPGGKLGRLSPEFVKELLPEGSELVKGDKQVTLYSRAEVRTLLADPLTLKLGDTAKFDRWFERMPKTAFLWLYQGENCSAADLLAGIGTAPAVPCPALLAAARVPNGIRVAGNSGAGLVEVLLRHYLANLPEEEDEAEPAPQPPPRTSAPAAPAPAEKCACEAALLRIKARPNRSPEPGPAGLRDCFGGEVPADIAAAVVYFGSSPAGNTPLAISTPGRHKDRFHVLFNDGTLKTYSLERPDSCRRIVSFLQTERRWAEKVWRQLMDLAAKLDAGTLK